jgi:hypothetical protein
MSHALYKKWNAKPIYCANWSSLFLTFVSQEVCITPLMLVYKKTMFDSSIPHTQTLCVNSSLALPQVVFLLNTSFLILWPFGHTEREFRELYIFAGVRCPAAESGAQSFCLHWLITCTVKCTKINDIISSIKFNVSYMR